jgi:signal transduction histidine kinase
VLLTLGRLRASGAETGPLLVLAIDELAASLEEIRELGRGLHPPVLAERGLVAALGALVLRTPMSVELDAVPDRRLSPQVEATVYYVVAEALANVQKHARARRVVVRAQNGARHTEVSVQDDGVGGADGTGAGLRGLADRVEALGGSLAIDTPPGGGTRLRAVVPHDGVPEPAPDRPSGTAPPSRPTG